jgi:hypothetical protein
MTEKTQPEATGTVISANDQRDIRVAMNASLTPQTFACRCRHAENSAPTTLSRSSMVCARC